MVTDSPKLSRRGSGTQAGGEGVRVLWFVNQPLPAVTRKMDLPGYPGGGWVNGLERALRLRLGVQLGVASVGPRPYEPFQEGGTTYYNLGAGESVAGFARVANRWRQVVRREENLSEFLSVIGQFQPDIVHIHGTESAFGLVCSHVTVPSVISIQGLLSVIDRMDYRGLDSSYVRSVSPGLFLRGGGIVSMRLRTRKAAERERRIIASCSNFIGRTRFDEDVVRALNPTCRYFPSDHRILRPEFNSPPWSGEDAVEPIVYCTAGAYTRKGVGTLLEAIALLKRGAIPQIQLRVGGSLGSPEEDERAALLKIRRLHLEGSVSLLGNLSAHDLVREMHGARVFVHPSHADNSPNALAEAMMVGVPCVASSVGGVPSMARDGVEALLVQDGDPYALAGALLRVLSNDELAAELGRNARETARARHDPELIVARLLSVYRELALEEASTPAPTE